jgi:hypothetical protein
VIGRFTIIGDGLRNQHLRSKITRTLSGSSGHDEQQMIEQEPSQRIWQEA